jgi:hypothetical protein
VAPGLRLVTCEPAGSKAKHKAWTMKYNVDKDFFKSI